MSKSQTIFTTFKKFYHVIPVKDACEMGMEKAIILNNIEDINIDGGGKKIHVSFDEYYKYFPYIEKDRFYVLFNELINEGHLKEVENHG